VTWKKTPSIPINLGVCQRAIRLEEKIRYQPVFSGQIKNPRDAGRKMMVGMEERRRHERYIIKDGFLVILGPSSAQIGKIVNIGLGGLSFLCKKNEKEISDPCEVSIVLGGTRTLKDGPFRFSANIVSDTEIENNIPYDSAAMKRFHLQFSELSYHQSFWLKKNIKNSSTGKL